MHIILSLNEGFHHPVPYRVARCQRVLSTSLVNSGRAQGLDDLLVVSGRLLQHFPGQKDTVVALPCIEIRGQVKKLSFHRAFYNGGANIFCAPRCQSYHT